MTIDIPTRPVEQAPPQETRGRRGLKGGPQINFGRSPAKQLLVVGGQPRANLLPPEIVLKRRQLKTRRALRVGVFFVLVGTVAACVGVWAFSSVSTVALTAAQDQQASLVEQQLSYGEVKDVQSTIATIQAGQMVGDSTEINLKDYLAKLVRALPKDAVLTTVAIGTGTPMLSYPQASTPLQGLRLGTIELTTSSTVLPTTADWLRALEKLPGFVDVLPGSVTFEEGHYISKLTMHIDDGALSMRFDPEHMAEEAAREAAAAKSDGVTKSMTPKDSTDGTSDGSTDGTTDGSTTDEGGK
jgi:hypothetical protein